MEAPSRVAQCHVRECVCTAAVLCASCGRACCATHSRSISIERRAERRETRGHRWMLERTPTSIKTYTLCLRCSKRPLTLTEP